ncbi:FUSC family protein [Mycolicibacterium sp. P1-18]|uniref:FUSC family protein n=1 Tax=Mycolicibacterium sp. P1-18 TaxID=2024615 RepID=UPI0011F40658|nr:FUSC family protein [Mycolicibacterium sp. P1-18]KAA0093991.1 FUSC family protein [Mycolicibacterium sp. P1-18]
MKGLPQRLAMPDLGAVGRSLLGVMLAAIAGLQWGSAGAATAAAGAAAIAGAAALQDSPRGPLVLVSAISIQMGAAVLLGTATSSYGVLFVLAATAWCFVAGLQWAVSTNAGLIAAASGALLVTAPPVAPTLSGVGTAALLALGGGLVQAVLIGLWPRRRWRLQRDALTRAYRSLGADAKRLAADAGAGVDPAPLLWLRDTVTMTDRQARRRPLAYRAWYVLPQRISVTLTTLAGRSVDDPAVATVLRAAAGVLDVVASRSRTAKRDATLGVLQVEAATDAVAVSNVALAQRLSHQLREAVALRFGELTPDVDHVTRVGRRGALSAVPIAVAAVRAHLTWGSPILRHALRLAAGVGAGVAVERFADVPYGYWIPLTVLIVLRPETAHTYTRCAGRVAGNAGGIVVASVVTIIWHPTGLAAAVLAVLALGVAYAVSGYGYVATSAALAAVVVFLVDVSNAGDVGTMTDRLIATLIGGALAVLVHVVLPDHSMVRLRQRAGELLKTEIDYAATVIKAFVHGLDHPGEALAAAWERAFRARAAFEAAAGATTSDSGDLRRWLKAYRTALNAITTSCATLESNLPATPPATLHTDFVVAVDEYAEALSGAPTAPGAPWRIDGDRLAAAEQRIREAGRNLGPDDTSSRVLVAEIGDITRSLVGITD